MGRSRSRDKDRKKGSRERSFYTPFDALKGFLVKPAAAGDLDQSTPRGPDLAAEPDEDGVGPLEDLVSGRARVDMRLTDEYMEGAVQEAHPDVLKNLAEGRYSHQDFLDLHGLTAQEAQAELLGFLEKSYSLNLRCVLVVHGRGLKSPGEPVLKKMVAETLTTGAGRKMVVAFATARQVDGGPGATYVLLRKHKKKGVFPK